MFKYFLIIFLCVFNNLSGQSYEYYGVLKLNDRNEEAISYRINFTEINGIIKGYSITDMTGEHETKNIIEGTYDSKTKLLTFKEKNIVYTKSKISQESFCFVNYTGKIKLSSSKKRIDGKFVGLFKNASKCIDGTITLVSMGTVNSLLQKANKKIQKSDELDEKTKKKYNPIEIFDSLRTNQLTTNQNLNVFSQSEKVTFEIWDREIEDGDIIQLYHNNRVILQNYKVVNAKKLIEVILDKDTNVFRIEAVDEGSSPPNTAMMIMVGENPVEFQSNLKVGESASITVINKN